LGHSGAPCTQRLSVAGFLVLYALFPLGGEVYSEGKGASFLSREASSLRGDGQRCRMYKVSDG